jgi:hypothetical protein
MLTPNICIVVSNITTTLVRKLLQHIAMKRPSTIMWSLRESTSTAEILVSMNGEIAPQNFCNTKENFLDYFTHDSWFLDSIERRHPIAFMLYSLSTADDRQP